MIKLRGAAALIVAAALSGIACGPSVEQQACDQLIACGVKGSAMTEANCASSTSECEANCINRASCDELVDALTTGMPTIGLGFLHCKSTCGGATGPTPEEKACDQLTACGVAGGQGCTLSACDAQCINSASCDELVDAFTSPAPTIGNKVINCKLACK